MIIYPAIDLRGGKVVRLIEGDPNRQTVHNDDPVAAAQNWKDAGAEWLHVINLDGALGEADLNLDILRDIQDVGLPVQFGGGLRSLDDASRALDSGAVRVILGTLAVKQPQSVEAAIHKFGVGAVAVALDARDGIVTTHGWQAKSDWSPVDLGKKFAMMGLLHALYTDISRDGKLQGVNVEATAELAQRTNLQVIASGGVASLNDVCDLLKVKASVAGVIIGKALYTGAFKLEDALELVNRGDQC